MLTGYFQRNGALFLRCIEKSGLQIMTIPAAITDFSLDPNQFAMVPNMKTYFTIAGLNEVVSILERALQDVY